MLRSTNRPAMVSPAWTLMISSPLTKVANGDVGGPNVPMYL
jgi:hypothetical protein